MNNSSSFSQYFPPVSTAPIPILLADLQALAIAGTIKPAQKYIITDSPKADSGIEVEGRPDGKGVLAEAIGGFLNADFQGNGTWTDETTIKEGIWSVANESSYTVGESAVIWNNQHYKLTEGDGVSDGTYPKDDGTNGYQLRTRANQIESGGFGYILEYDKIIYDLTTDTILWRMDKRDNKIKSSASNLTTFDWGNDRIMGWIQEGDCTLEILNHAGENIYGVQGVGTYVYINNDRGNADTQVRIFGSNASLTANNNTGGLGLLEINSSIVSANNNSGSISGRYADGANWNYDNNTEDWVDVDATNGSNGVAATGFHSPTGSEKSKYLQCHPQNNWAQNAIDGFLPAGQFVFVHPKKENGDSAPNGTDLGIRIFCETKNEFALRASGGFLNPNYGNAGSDISENPPYSGVGEFTGVAPHNMRGIWQAANEGGYNQGDIVIWNGLHYQWTGDSMQLTGDNPSINPHYTLLPKSATNVGYIEEWDDIEYDFENNWIQSREDKRGNKVTDSFSQSRGSIAVFQWGRTDTYSNNVIESKFNCINNLAQVNGNYFTGDSDVTYNQIIARRLSNCRIESMIADFNASPQNYDSKMLSPYLSTFDAEYSLIEVGNIADVPDYIGIVAVNSANPIYSIVDFTNTPTFKRKLYATNSDVMFDNSVRLRFPTPSTGTTINGNNLDFVEFLWSAVANKFIQTTSEQY